MSLSPLPLIWLSHFILDFSTGFFSIYKTLAGFNLSYAALIAGLCGFSAEISQVYFGRIADRGKRKQLILTGLLLSSAAFLFPLAKSLSVATLLLFFVTLGSGCFHPAGSGMAALMSKQDRSKTMAIFASGGAFGLAISQLAFSTFFILHPYCPLLFFIPLLLIVYFWFRFSVEETKSQEGKKPFFDLLFRKIFSKKSLLFLYLTQVCNYAFIFALFFYLPDVLRAKNSADWLWKGGGHLLMTAGNALMLPLLGKLCDRFHHAKVLFILGTVGLLGFFFFLIGPPLPSFSLAVLLLVMGATFCPLNPLSVSWGLKIYAEYPSTLSAVLMGFAWGIADLCFAIFSYLSPKNNIDAHLLTISSLTVMSLILIGIVAVFERREKALATAN